MQCKIQIDEEASFMAGTAKYIAKKTVAGVCKLTLLVGGFLVVTAQSIVRVPSSAVVSVINQASKDLDKWSDK